jgi:hypothetical protein
MAMNPIYVEPKVKKGGGLFGKIIGGLAGLAAAPFTGGMSVPAAIGATAGAMGLGGMVGGMAGEAISPTKVTEGKSVGSLDTALKADPHAQLAMLNEGQKALGGYPMDTNEAEGLNNYFEAAKQDLMRRMKIGTGNYSTG